VLELVIHEETPCHKTFLIPEGINGFLNITTTKRKSSVHMAISLDGKNIFDHHFNITSKVYVNELYRPEGNNVYYLNGVESIDSLYNSIVLLQKRLRNSFITHRLKG
jgi:hypothetical protein